MQHTSLSSRAGDAHINAVDQHGHTQGPHYTAAPLPCCCCCQLGIREYQQFLSFMCPGYQQTGVFPPLGTNPGMCPRPIFGTYDDHDSGWNNGNTRCAQRGQGGIGGVEAALQWSALCNRHGWHVAIHSTVCVTATC